ncbi:ribulose-bisphosphate carboxylase large subunit, partial [bacterium (Candidatus Moisslbacteria) CG12_big_fil_rev_8_21_14_0_65_36_11]
MRQDYIDLKYKPKKNEVIALYYLEPARGVSFEEVANHLAGESSIDTWSDILTLSPSLASKLKPHVFFLNKKKKIIKVAYHLDLFEINSIPQILSALAGNIFSL